MKKKKLLLHTCCAPCSVWVARELARQYDVTCIFYNPNIDNSDEYDLRLFEMEKLARRLGMKLMTYPFDPEIFHEAAKGFEAEPEGGARCVKCFELRLMETARVCAREGMDLFATTLTVAPMKNAALVNAAGMKAAQAAGVMYLSSNFKKKDGYKKSVDLSKQMGMYRQNYCGCSFSFKSREPG